MHDKPFVCPLCGAQFASSEVVCHSSCPLSAGCKLICCPSCGYQIPDDNQMVVTGTLMRLWMGFRITHNPTSMEASD